jgi:acetyl-CoA carboxylase biotin carboxyl carrier protein
MTIEEIRELIQVVVESGVAELEVQRGENRVRIRRTRTGSAQEITVGAGEAHPRPIAVAASAPSAPAASAAPMPGAEDYDAAQDPSLVLVKSPIVGTFYESGSPGAPAFVRPGDNIEPGKVLCIIESMKLMNEIEAEIAGVVEARLVENGQPVEYGEALFAIRPL